MNINHSYIFLFIKCWVSLGLIGFLLGGACLILKQGFAKNFSFLILYSLVSTICGPIILLNYILRGCTQSNIATLIVYSNKFYKRVFKRRIKIKYKISVPHPNYAVCCEQNKKLPKKNKTI